MTKHYKDADNNIFGFEQVTKTVMVDDVEVEVSTIPEGLTEITMAEIPAILEAKKPIEQVKGEKASEIRSAYRTNSVLPVLHLGQNWNGGFDSAIKLDAAKRLAEMGGAIEVTFFDVDNVPHVLTLAEATAVTMAVAGAYQVALANKQSKLTAIADAITVADVKWVVW